MNNINNRLISSEEILNIVNNLLEKPILINSIDIYQQAFVHKSFITKESFVDDEDICCAFYYEPESSNERLEFLGDSVLNMVTAEYLFKLYPSSDEGFLTKLRTKLVRNTQLSHIGTQLGFKDWLLISTSIERIDGRDNPRLVEDVFESFIAALYKDQGFYTTREFIFNCFDKYTDVVTLVATNDNYKDTLLRYFQMNSWSHPVYDTISVTGTSTTKSFTTVVLIKKNVCENSQDFSTVVDIDSAMKELYKISYPDDYMLGVGSGKTKKESQQNASKTTLEVLNVSKKF